MNKTFEILGGLIGGGLLVGGLDYIARKESSKNNLKLETKRMEHERYIMDHPSEFEQFRDADRCMKAETDRDKYAQDAKTYKNWCDERDERIIRLEKERDTALKQVQAYAEKELFGIYKQRGIDFHDIDPSSILTKLQYSFIDDDKRLEAMKIIFGEGATK